MNLQPVIERFRSLRVAVIGDAILDRYVMGRTERLCRQAPAPIVQAETVLTLPGGAANVAMHCAALGATTSFVSMLGNDQEARLIRQALVRAEVKLQCGSIRARQTAAKTRFLADGQIVMRLDEGTAVPFPDAWRWERFMTRAFFEHDLIILSDYGYGAFGPKSFELLRRLRAGASGLLAADSRNNLSSFARLSVDFMKPNYLEALALLGIEEKPPQRRIEFLRSHRRALLDASRCGVLAVTVDREGAVVFEREGSEHFTPAVPVKDSKATGAGDAYLSVFALSLAAGAPVPAAAELAGLGARLAIAQEGAGVCGAETLLAELSGRAKIITAPEMLAARLEAHRAKGQKIVFTNGCFDMFHTGNLSCLRRAKGLGDILLVGVNSDASVRRVKGPGRPVNRLNERLKLLSALDCVDYLISFEDDTASPLVEQVRPDVLVKGADYSSSSLPEARVVERLGGRVVILPLVEAESTSRILARIRENSAHEEISAGSGMDADRQHSLNRDEGPPLHLWAASRSQ